MTRTISFADYVSCDATALRQLIVKREVDAAEVTATAQALMRALNPDLNVLIELFDEPLAHAADGPFGGVPFVIKDLVCHAEGVLNESCSRLTQGLRATADTALMQRWRAAGLSTIARVATPEFGYCATTESLVNGPSRNPWDLSRAPGGSSGASAASVAAGIVPFAHANDGGGSIRIPAACNGLVGLKPSRGRVTLGPDVGEALNGIAIEFAVTRTVRDAARLLDCVAGPSLGDPYIIAPPPAPYAEMLDLPVRGLRIAVMTEAWSGVPIQQEMKTAVLKTAQIMESLGHNVEVAAPPLNSDTFMAATHVYWTANLYSMIQAYAAITGRKVGPDTLEATTLACYEDGKRMSADDLLRALAVGNQVTRSFATWFQDYDVLLTPAMAEPALKLGTIKANDASVSAREWTEQQFRFSPFTPQFNMTGQPAICLPLHRTADNLPIGIQCVGRCGEEHVLLQLAAQLEQQAPWPLIAPLWQKVQA